MDIQDRRELFIDRYLIDSMENTRLELKAPRAEETAIEFNQPWATHGGYTTIIKDEDLYRMYYSGRYDMEGGGDQKGEVTCYAESSDGKSWEQPELGIFEVQGTSKNNVVYLGDRAAHNFSPFIDVRPGVPQTGRYKALGGVKKMGGLFAFVSPDGIHWSRAAEEPVITDGAFDSQNLAFYSMHEQRYCCYFRVFIDGIRTIARTTSQDFLEWTEPVIMTFGNTPMEHLYINQTEPYFRAPHIYIALPARFVKDRKILSDEEGREFAINHHRGVGYWQDCAEAVFMSSRGGNRYDRTFMEGFIRPGLDRRNWGSRCTYPALGVVPTGDTEMSLYIKRHNQQPSEHLQRFSLRTDGFASVRAPYSGGEMLTKALSFSGGELTINYATGAGGHIKVELQDESGIPVRGFTASECDTVIGDHIDRVVTWNGSPDVSALAGTTVRVRFAMKDADLYSLRFREQLP